MTSSPASWTWTPEMLSKSQAKPSQAIPLPCPPSCPPPYCLALKGKVNNDFRFWLPYATFGATIKRKSFSSCRHCSCSPSLATPPSARLWLSTWLLAAHTSKRVSRSHANKEVKHKKSAGGINAPPASLVLPSPPAHPFCSLIQAHIHYQRQQQQQQ